jgi:hypothetical protein
MSATTLAKYSLCKSNVDYQGLLASLAIVGIPSFPLWYTNDGQDNAGQNMVNPDTGNGFAMDELPWSCFKPIQIAHYSKDCLISCCPFTAALDFTDECVTQALTTLNKGEADLDTFDKIIASFVLFLSGSAGDVKDKPLDEVLNVIKVFCDVISQMVATQKYLKKAAFTTNECEL